jgi:hypothetical protein
MLFYHDIRRWIRITNVQWDPATRTLQFSHPNYSASPQVRDRVFVCSIDGDGQRGNGTVSEVFGNSIIGLPWQITRMALAGMWQGRVTYPSMPLAPGQSVTLALSCLEGSWRGRVLFGLDWWPIASVAVQATGFAAVGVANLSDLVASLGAGGDLVVQDGNTDTNVMNWTLRRLPDGVPF